MTTNGSVIDAHMHIYPTREAGIREKNGYAVWEYGQHPGVQFSEAAGDPLDARQALDEAKASRAIVANLFVPPPDALDPLAALIKSNKWVCGLAVPDARLVPFVCADPRFGADQLHPHLEEMVSDYGARGLKIHPVVQDLNLTDASCWRFFALAESLGVPVLAHSGSSRMAPQSADPEAFRPILGAFPRLRLLLAHLGGGSWRQTIDLAADYPNVLFDCSEIIHWVGAAEAPTEVELVALIRRVGINRVLLGSDFPWYGLDETLARVDALPDLKSSERDAIVGDNAAALLDGG